MIVLPFKTSALPSQNGHPKACFRPRNLTT